MATGAQPALEPKVDNTTEAQEAPARPLTLKERIVRKLLELFEHNERLGTTRL